MELERMRQGPESPGRHWLECVQQSILQARDRVEKGPKSFHKVPLDLRRANPTDYDPMSFTFGPCHSKFEVPLCSSDLVKVQIAQALTTPQSFNHLGGTIERQDGVIRKIYEEYLQFDIKPEVLAYLLALDALTIVAGAIYQSKLDPVYSLGPAIWRDAMLLEQQLPLFILEAAIDSLAIPPDRDDLAELLGPPTPTSTQEYRSLYKEIFSGDEVPTSSPVYMRAVVKFYGVTAFLYPFQSRAKMWKWRDPSNHEQSMLSHIYHTLEPHVAEAVVKIKYIMPYGAADSGDESDGMSLSCWGAQTHRPSKAWRDELLGRLPTASKLRRCGIHFKAGNGSFTGIKFDATECVVTLPEITVFDTTKTYLLNLVAQEVLSSNLQEWPVTSYIALMDALIDTEEDVKILVDASVIRNVLGSHEELAKMWNSLAVNLPIRYTSDDRKVIGEVSEASRQCFRKCWAGFRDTYYDRKPWLFISIVAASCLFLLALLQTAYTILQYNNRSR